MLLLNIQKTIAIKSHINIASSLVEKLSKNLHIDKFIVTL